MNIRKSLLCSAVAVVCASAGGQAMAQQTAPATGAAAGGIGTVTITARKRAENVQRVPETVTAVSAKVLTQQHITEPSDLSRIVPSLISDNSAPGSPNAASFILRGQGPSDVLLSFSSPVALYEDSVNIPHAVGTNLALFDINRIEVLEGPQGTLYGRNSSSGAINIITRGADQNGYHGFISAEGGNYNDWKLGGAVNIPVVPDVLAVRLAYQHWSRDGFGQSVITGQRLGDPHDDDTARLSVLFNPAPNFSANLKAEYDRSNITGGMYQTVGLFPSFLSPPFPAAIPPFPHPSGPEAENQAENGVGATPLQTLINAQTARGLFTNYSNNRVFDHYYGFHLVDDMTWNITPDVALRSITGYHFFTDTNVFDLDSLPAQLNVVGAGKGCTLAKGVFGSTDSRPCPPNQTSATVSQELDLSGTAFDNHLHWLTGFYYQSDTGHGRQTALVDPGLFPGMGGDDVNFDALKNTSSTWGVFTQDDIKINDIFSITGGLRYTSETIGQTFANYLYFFPGAGGPAFLCLAGPNSFSFALSSTTCANTQNHSDDGLSYLVSLNAQVTPDVLLYAKTAKGFQGSQFPGRVTASPTNLTLPGALAPESNTEYEVGMKSEFFDHRLRANLDWYDDSYSNLAISAIVPVMGGGSTTVVTSSNVHIEGFEAALTAIPIDHLTLSAITSYIYSTYGNAPTFPFFNGTINATGARNPLPPWNFNVGARYDIQDVGPGVLSVSANYDWHDTTPTSVLNNFAAVPNYLPGTAPATGPTLLSKAQQNKWFAAVGLVNAQIEYNLPQQGLTFTVFATNLLNTHYQTEGLANLPFGYVGQTQDPAMWGVSIRKTFGAE